MRAVVRVCGELGLTVGGVLLLLCAYLIWGTGSYTAGRQAVLREQLQQPPQAVSGGSRAPDGARTGEPLAMLRIPRFGDDYRYVVVEGVGRDELRAGPGHYPGTAPPGGTGNFVLAGHRTTYAAPFNRIDELRRGDEIIVDARDARYVYRVTETRIVAPTEMSVIAPVPGSPGRRPTRARITLSTCHPEYSAAQRLVVFGRLDDRRDPDR
ncbi:class E sortase [Planobispora siamensis]|uniref:class E sortase n=1 Tax=Planobispora siamensis TaxID=936338 RepID=UPI00194EFD01|nr:class E sortase [Planobispora siamensis]